MSDELRQHLRQSGRFFLLLLAIPLVLGFTFVWMSMLGFILSILIFPAMLIALALGAFLYTRDGIGLALRPGPVAQRAFVAVAAPAVAGATLFLSLTVFAGGAQAATAARLLIYQRTYEAIIAEVRAGRHREGGHLEAHGVEFIVDQGAPIRLAFEPEGLFDNRSGIVFDPTGAVMQADGFDPETGEFAAPDEITKLFDGDLVKCRWLWGDYYSCSFT